MSKPLTDAEIAERVAQDDGPLDEEVQLKRSSSGSRYIYHDADDPCFDADTSGQRRPPETVTREEAIDRGLGPCRLCILGFEPSATEHDLSAYQAAQAYDPDVHDSLADVSLDGGDA